MDGLFIDSEPLWREAEIATFGSIGIALTDALCRESTGLRTDEVVRHWHGRFPWNGPTCQQVTKQLLEAAERLIVERGTLMNGALQAVSELHSAEHEIAGKPDPAVYRTTISLLGVSPEQCLAIEDSPAGVRSAKSAGAQVIAVPAPENAHNPEFALADVVLASLQDFSLDLVRGRRSHREAVIPMIRRLYLTIILGFALTGCESEPKFALSPATMDCDQSSCLVAFEITNTSEGALPLIYDISLSQNYIRDPNKSGLVVVGIADGEIELPPNETKKLEVEVAVTEEPNGSKVSVFDSRTPEIILEILDF
jgi:sugar-phosphatase